ncbi:MAG: hypothetical protein WCK25_05190, partial [Actinomycetes bacterium]
AVGMGGAGGYLEMNVYKPLMIYNITHSITLMTDGCTNFRKFLVEGTKPNRTPPAWLAITHGFHGAMIASWISASLRSPRQMTTLPGGGSEARAR